MLQPLGGIQRAPAGNAGRTADVKAGDEARRDGVVEQVMHDPVPEVSGPDFARLGVRDDKADAAAGPVGLVQQLGAQRAQVLLGVGFKCLRAGALAFVSAAVQPGPHQVCHRKR